MTKLKTFLAASLLLPLIAFGNSLGASLVDAPEAFAVTDADATAAPSSETAGAQTYKCCWVLHMGVWYCIPC